MGPTLSWHIPSPLSISAFPLCYSLYLFSFLSSSVPLPPWYPPSSTLSWHHRRTATCEKKKENIKRPHWTSGLKTPLQPAKIAPRCRSSTTWNDFDHLGGKGPPGGLRWNQRRCEDGMAKEEHAWLNLNEERAQLRCMSPWTGRTKAAAGSLENNLGGNSTIRDV